MRGAVFWVNLPPPQGFSRVQAGRRPAVIVHTASTFSALGVTVIVPGTSREQALRFPHTVRVEPSPTNGLLESTVFLAFQVQAVDKRLLQAPQLGVLSPDELARVDRALREVLDLG